MCSYIQRPYVQCHSLCIGVLSFRGPKSKGLTCSSVKFSDLTSRCLYTLRGLTSSGRTSKGVTSSGLTFRDPTSSGLTTRGVMTRGSFIQGSHVQCSYEL